MHNVYITVAIKQVLCAIIINIPMFMIGMSIGWMSPMALLLQSKDSPSSIPLSNIEISWMAAVSYLTSIPAVFLMDSLNEIVGRKATLTFISATSAASWVVLLASHEIWALIISRVLTGISMTGGFVVCPVYIKEIAEPSLQWISSFLMEFLHITGIAFAYILGGMCSYRTTLWICLTFPTFHLIIFMMMPESPSFLVKIGDFEEASRVLSWLRCKKESDYLIKLETSRIKKEQTNSKMNIRNVVHEILSNRIFLKAFSIALMIKLTQGVCGSVTVIHFAGYIFSLTTNDFKYVCSPNKQAIILGIFCISGSVFGLSVRKAERKPLLVTTCIILGLSMCAVASWFAANEHAVYFPDWVPLVLLTISMFCAFSVLRPLPDIIKTEIFDKKCQTAVMLITASVASFVDFLQLLFFIPVISSIGIHVVFYCYGIISLFIAVCIIMFVPETKGRNTEDIYAFFRKK